MVPRGLEPRTLWLLAIRSNQLSYETCWKSTHSFRSRREFWRPRKKSKPRLSEEMDAHRQTPRAFARFQDVGRPPSPATPLTPLSCLAPQTSSHRNPAHTNTHSRLAPESLRCPMSRSVLVAGSTAVICIDSIFRRDLQAHMPGKSQPSELKPLTIPLLTPLVI